MFFVNKLLNKEKKIKKKTKIKKLIKLTIIKLIITIY